MIQTIKTFGFWIILILIGLGVSFGIISSKKIIPGFRSFLIQSGSMEPTIKTGDVILVRKQTNYQENDIVTFIGERNRKVTHRIIEVKQTNDGLKFKTKGDANRSIDQDQINPEQIIGQMAFRFPKLGYAITFARKPKGIILLLIIPLAVIILDELNKVSDTETK